MFVPLPFKYGADHSPFRTNYRFDILAGDFLRYQELPAVGTMCNDFNAKCILTVPDC